MTWWQRFLVLPTLGSVTIPALLSTKVFKECMDLLVHTHRKQSFAAGPSEVQLIRHRIIVAIKGSEFKNPQTPRSTSDAAFLREHSCKPDLESEAVSASLPRHPCRGAAANHPQCVTEPWGSPTFTCLSQLLCPSLRSRGQVLFPRRLMNCFHFQTYFSDK